MSLWNWSARFSFPGLYKFEHCCMHVFSLQVVTYAVGVLSYYFDALLSMLCFQNTRKSLMVCCECVRHTYLNYIFVSWHTHAVFFFLPFYFCSLVLSSGSCHMSVTASISWHYFSCVSMRNRLMCISNWWIYRGKPERAPHKQVGCRISQWWYLFISVIHLAITHLQLLFCTSFHCLLIQKRFSNLSTSWRHNQERTTSPMVITRTETNQSWPTYTNV